MVQYSDDKKRMEYIQYIMNFPELIPHDKEKVLMHIQSLLDFDRFSNNRVAELDFSHCSRLFPCLNQFSIASGISFKYVLV